MIRTDADSLRAIADRMAQRAEGTFQEYDAALDAITLDEIADRIDDATRPLTDREIDGLRKPSLWRRMCRRWTRRF